MKTLIGVLLLLATALLTCRDTQAAKKWSSKSAQLCTRTNFVRTFSLSTTSEASVKDIPPVGCALPMAQLEKVVQ